MRKKVLSIVGILFVAIVNLCAQQISQNEAFLRASIFYGSASKTNGASSTSSDLKLVYTGGNSQAPDYYVFSNIQKGGYVIIAGDERMPDPTPIYSLSGNFDPAQMPDGFRGTLNQYAKEVAKARTGAPISRKTRSAGSIVPLSDLESVVLMETLWAQEDPYNRMCLKINKTYKYTGCGATATTQMMRYHKWPVQGIGKYKNPAAPDKEVNYAAELPYQWDNMLPIYDGNATAAQKDEVARLMYHVGNALDMLYGTDGSGTSIHKIPRALTSHFGYSPNLKIAYRLSYSEEEWIALIKKEIDHKRPVIYAGVGDLGAHLFVCDGYNNKNQLHYNYGWGGYLNGFTSTIGGHFPVNNVILIGAYPNDGRVVADADQAAPQIVLTAPLNSTNYSPKLGASFNIAARAANYSTHYNGTLGLALFDEKKVMVGDPIISKAYTLATSNPAATSSEGVLDYEITFPNVVIPKGTKDGKYTLDMVAKQGTVWFPAANVQADVTKHITVKVANGVATLDYPVSDPEISKMVELQLTKPIDVAVLNNRATIKFSISNRDDFFASKDSMEIAILASPNQSPLPTTIKRIAIKSLGAGLTRDYEVTDVPVAPGTDVNSCRFYVAYNRETPNPTKDRDVTFLPMMPANYNFYEYSIPKEATIFSINFSGNDKVSIPSGYKAYNKENQENPDTTRPWVRPYLMNNAVAFGPSCKLVTTAFEVPDENCVLEWSIGDPYGTTPLVDYTLYISTTGQGAEDFKNFIEPNFTTSLPNHGIARYSLADFAGKEVYIALGIPQGNYLKYFKILNIKNPIDISIPNVSVPGSVLPGESASVKMTVKNHSARDVTKVTGTYTVGDGTPVTETFNTQIPFNQTVELTFSKQIAGKGKAGDVFPIKIHAEQDGEETPQLGNNDATAQLMLVNFFPKKGILAFKTTKIGCAGCQLTYAILDEMDRRDPEMMSAVELWRNNGSNYHIPDYNGLTTEGSTPTFFLNGAAYPSRISAMEDVSNVSQRMSPPANISVQTSYANPDSSELKITIKSHFALPLKGNYRLGAIVIENNVFDTERQITGTISAADRLKLVKNHIPLTTIGGSNGATGHLIENPASEEYVYECNYTIPAKKGSRNIIKDNIQVIGVLYGSNGAILNSATDSRYLKLTKAEGLTFVPVKGYPNLKKIDEVVVTNETNYKVEEVYRGTIPTGSDYQFKIEKDPATWGNKVPKLYVNKDSRVNLSSEKDELLIPDENGVYTIKAMDKHYFINIAPVAEGEPLVSRKGTELILTGTWTVNDFKRLSLNYDDVTSLDMSSIAIPTGVPALQLPNSNALIYVAAGAVVPASWKNVVKGKQAVEITLTDGYPFANTKEFVAQHITYKRSIENTGFSTQCLPFEVSMLPAGIKVESFSSSEESQLTFKEETTVKANTPYMVNVTDNNDKEFTASNVIVPTTVLPLVAKGSFTFKGTYSEIQAGESDNWYISNADGTSFRKATSTDPISAFRSYIHYSGTTAPEQLEVKHSTGGGVGITDLSTADGLTVKYIDNTVFLYTPAPRWVNIYGVDGRRVDRLYLQEGMNPLTLEKGIYLVENLKVVMK